jgi:hypothetical protein
MCATCVWSKAPFGIKKYPAVAGYLIKMEQSSTNKRSEKRAEKRADKGWLAWKRWAYLSLSLLFLMNPKKRTSYLKIVLAF